MDKEDFVMKKILEDKRKKSRQKSSFKKYMVLKSSGGRGVESQ